MAGEHLNFPFDAEIFNYSWKNTPDLILTSMINSGAVVKDSEIARLISNGSNFFTTPYYNMIGGDEQVYNGATDFAYDTLTGGTYSGVVYGRMKAWDAISFIKDFNSGADPMSQIVAGVANYWIKKRQERFVGILDALFGISGDADWAKHITNIAATSGTTAQDTNLIGVTSINDACVKANGDNAGSYSLVICHSVVANRLANLQLLEFSKYTDSAGITRNLPIGTINGKTLIVNDSVPVDTGISYALTADVTLGAGKTYYTRTGSSAPYTYTAVVTPDVDDIATYYEKTDLPDAYTTYILGAGCMRFAEAPVDVPSEMDRDAKTKGGVDMIYTRIRECFAPYGFSFKGDVETDVGVPDSVLHASASWERKMPAKAIFMSKLVTNG